MYPYPEPKCLQDLAAEFIYREWPRSVPLTIQVNYVPHTDLELDFTVIAPSIKSAHISYPDEPEETDTVFPPDEPTLTHYPALNWTVHCAFDMRSYVHQWPGHEEGMIREAIYRAANQFLAVYFDTEREGTRITGRM